MSEAIKHECGLALIRLKKPIEHYLEKYGTATWGLKRLQMLMAKQLNRGQDGSGIGIVKLNPDYGERYIARKRSNSKSSLADVFHDVFNEWEKLTDEQQQDIPYLKKNFPYMGEILMGHLRYGTHGRNSIENIHPFLRQNNWMSRNLMIAGNYNLTNVDQLFTQLIDLGQQPKEKSDNVTMLEKIGHFLDEENQVLFRKFKDDGMDNTQIAEAIKENLSIENILRRAFRNLDGGFNMAGLIGNGSSFAVRDSNGIRPSFYVENDEVVAVASERSALMTVFNLHISEVKELTPGHALIIDHNANTRISHILPQAEKLSCSFERIYFSKGNDVEIYKERKMLGELLSERVLKKVDYNFDETVFSYIPNTASTSFYGLIDGVNHKLETYKLNKLLELGKDGNSSNKVEKILRLKTRREKILLKDVKMRTFITNDTDREGLVGSVYDVTYGIVRERQDTLVIMDDSIVRGTTLTTSILAILERLKPKKVIIVSSAPQIRYPDCYGIDMSRLSEFICFRALIELCKENKLEHKIEETYKIAQQLLEKPLSEVIENPVRDLYGLFTTDQITDKVVQMITPDNIGCEVDIIFQSISNLHTACPNHKGDWYFTGNYPTNGGFRVVNKAFVNYFEGSNERSY
jgi:amidophosphoribosyltransferase